MLRGLVDTMLANRKLFVLHERNRTALSALHDKGHEGDHEEIEQQFRQILGNPAIPARDRVRLSCALGALMSSLMSFGALEDLGPAAYGDLLREAITDLLEPPGIPAAAGVAGKGTTPGRARRLKPGPAAGGPGQAPCLSSQCAMPATLAAAPLIRSNLAASAGSAPSASTAYRPRVRSATMAAA